MRTEDPDTKVKSEAGKVSQDGIQKHKVLLNREVTSQSSISVLSASSTPGWAAVSGEWAAKERDHISLSKYRANPS